MVLQSMNRIKNVTEYLSRRNRMTSSSKLSNSEVGAHVTQLKERGYVTLDHLVGSELFENAKKILTKQIEIDLQLDFPCLAQTKIDAIKHRELIESNFLASKEYLHSQNCTFDRSDVRSYTQMINDFKPSTLKMPMPHDPVFYRIWLDPVITEIVSQYMGFYPQMVEAYVRRNFPCTYPVMNHYWHRDTNHTTHLLKCFIFFTDCDLQTGAHHYIEGSVRTQSHRDKTYYNDQEIHSVWPIGSKNHMISNVPAGTIIIEDTRGLHKAGIPEKLYRDLGYAVFLPPNFFKKQRSLYKIREATYSQLTKTQQLFIPSQNKVVNN